MILLLLLHSVVGNPEISSRFAVIWLSGMNATGAIAGAPWNPGTKVTVLAIVLTP
ncbi:hypothetical protein ACIFOT_21560 [Neobacillus sp. NRS-1170]|uniref:hypothetical protein n=1 Tax=Neobacillus sp. NRS-1170 TaxID=3233898 RepID=UPI003D2ADD3E